MVGRDELDAIARGVCEAFADVLTAYTSQPIAREDLLEAVTEGVRQAFVEVFGKALGA